MTKTIVLNFDLVTSGVPCAILVGILAYLINLARLARRLKHVKNKRNGEVWHRLAEEPIYVTGYTLLFWYACVISIMVYEYIEKL